MSLPKRSAAHAWRRQMRRHPLLRLMRDGRRVHQRQLEEVHRAQPPRARGEAGGVDEAVHSELAASCSSSRSTSLDLGSTGSILMASSAHVCFTWIWHPQAKPGAMDLSPPRSIWP
uniref:Uncharacterized protein n=1 Tax=Arundo donax TaxID=35708 RepID=A0A0A9DNM6_ARUDO